MENEMAGIYIVSIKEKDSEEVSQSWDFYTEEEAMKKYWEIKQSNNEVVTVSKITFGKEENANN